MHINFNRWLLEQELKEQTGPHESQPESVLKQTQLYQLQSPAPPNERGTFDDLNPEWEKYQIKEGQRVFFSSTPFSGARHVTQKTMAKPQGLWYGCGDSWLQWMRSEMPSWVERANYLYEIKLGSNIFKISNENEFESFERKYRINPKEWTINAWKKLEEQGYNGIEICPYLWSKRMRSNWYYPWDVASGCIWDGRGLFSAELLVEKSAKVSEDDWAKKEKERMDKIMADSDKNRAKADAAKARLAAGWEKYRYDPQTGEKLF